MVKFARKPKVEAHESHEEELEEEDEVAKFGQVAINQEQKLLQRLAEVRENFYNRLSSKQLINATKGRIPFTEHMTISKHRPAHPHS